MRVSERQMARACVELLREGELNPHEVSRSVLEFLSKKHWTHRSDQVFSEVYRALNADEGIIPITVTNIRALSESEKSAIEKLLARLFPTQTVECTWKEDPSLIGGMVLETENMRYDASLQSALRKLSHSYSL